MSAKFEELVLSRFDKLDERLDRVDERLAGVDERLDGIDERLDGIDEKLSKMDKKIDANHDEVMTLCRQLDQTDRMILGKVNELDQRMQCVESVLKERWDIPNMKIRLDVVENKVSKMI